MTDIYTRAKRFFNKRILFLRGFWLKFYRSWVIRSFKNSTVSYPWLIHPSTRMTDSRIQGQVSIGQDVIILDSVLNGEIQIGDHCGVDRTEIFGNVKVGRRTALNGPSRIYSMLNPVTIGNFCSIAGYVTIQEYNHNVGSCSTYFVKKHVMGEDMREEVVSKGGIFIGNDVWIGAQTVILSGAKILDGAVIGANSTVTGTIPPYAIAAGSPARVIKYRFSRKIIDRLLELAWWTWSDDVIRENRDLFNGPLTIEKILKITNNHMSKARSRSHEQDGKK